MRGTDELFSENMSDRSDDSEVTKRGNQDAGALGTVGGYTLLKKLGGGGFGAVYLAQDVKNNKYALKTIHPAIRTDDKEMARLEETFSRVYELRHDHIVAPVAIIRPADIRFFDEKTERELRLQPGDPIIVMHYARGGKLSDWRLQFEETDGRVPPGKATEIARQIASALDYAHGRKIVHRDVTPSNVIVDERDGVPDVQVIDFGLAAQIRSSMNRHPLGNEKAGTDRYMAPEQWEGKPADGRTDQYALGVLLYEMLSGAVPFAGIFDTKNVDYIMQAVGRNQPATIPELSAARNWALRKALAKKPADRFRSCSEFVEAFAANRTVSAPAAAPVPEPPVAAAPAAAAAPAPAATPEASSPGSVSPGRVFSRSLEKIVPFVRSAAGRLPAPVRNLPGALADRFPRLADAFGRFGPAGADAAGPGGPAAHARSGTSGLPGPVLPAQPGPCRPEGPVQPVSVGFAGGSTLEMVEIPRVSFSMGSPQNEPDRRPGEGLHDVILSTPFRLAVAPVTREQWRAVAGNDPSKAPGEGDDLPVDSVSWDDCRAFLGKLGTECPVPGWRWTLPTEAQWECACRAGSTGPYAGTGSPGDMGWHSGNSGGSEHRNGAAHPVRRKNPNAWGFYDMHGNVWEWCLDGWSPSLGHNKRVDPCTSPSGPERVVRGGSWNHAAVFCRSASRRGVDRTSRFDSIGFRVALVPAT